MDGVSFVVIALAPFAVSVLAASRGVRHFRDATIVGYVRLAFLSTGLLGMFLQTACCFFAASDDPRARFVDCIDWGPWTGVPTPLVALLYLLAFALLVALTGFYTCRSVSALLRKPKTSAKPRQ